MSNANDPIVDDFIKESKQIVLDLLLCLEQAEAGLAHAKELETYGQMVDRIFGAAKSLSVNITGSLTIEKIGDYAGICKAVGYKASQITDNAEFYAVCVAMLMDATEALSEMLQLLETDREMNPKEVVSQTLIDRLKWVSGKFSADYRETVAVKKQVKLNQDEIDSLMSKLGLD